MEVKNCKRCGKLFQYVTGKPICPACKQQDEDDFDKVKNYLYEYPRTSLMEVSEATQVSIASIRKFLREDRLIISEDSEIGIECENCGVTIKSGRYCRSCMASLNNEMRAVTRPQTAPKEKQDIKQTDPKKTKMHYLNKDKLN